MTTRQTGTRPPSLTALAADLGLKPDILDRYREALRELLALRRLHPEAFPQLVASVLCACEEARAWRDREDPHAGQRQRDREVLEDLQPALNAIKRLRRFITKHAGHTDLAIYGTVLAARREGITLRWKTESGKAVTRPAMMDRVLELLAESLEHGMPARRGPFQHRIQE